MKLLPDFKFQLSFPIESTVHSTSYNFTFIVAKLSTMDNPCSGSHEGLKTIHAVASISSNSL